MNTIFTQKASRFFFSLLAMMLCSVNAMAGAKIYFDGLNINAGETATANLMLENDEEVTGIQYTIALPQGLTITGCKANSERIVRGDHSISYNQKGEYWVFTVSSPDLLPIPGSEGAIATVTFAADNSFTGGDIVPQQSGVVLTSTSVDASGNAIKVETEAPVLSINKLAASLTVSAEEITLSAENATAVISVGLTNSKPVQGVELKAYLPEGLNPVFKTGTRVNIGYGDRLDDDFIVSANYIASENSIKFALTNDQGGTIAAGNGELFTFSVTADVKALAETSVVSLTNGVVTDVAANAVELDPVTINVTNAQVAIDKAAEEARVAANQAAAEADMAKVEALQAELSEIIKGNDEFISEEDNKAIEEFLGEKYPMAIQAALEAVADEGNYVSPINEEELRAIINGIKANIEAAKKAAEDAEAARVAANQAAAEADMAKVEALQSELSEIIKGNEEYISEEDNKAIEEFLGEKYAMAIQAALEAVADEGNYVSPINEDELRAIINGIKANIEAAKKAAEDAEAARVAANQAAAEADMAKVEALQAELSEIIKGNDEFISEEDNKAIEEFLGEKYALAIQAALDAVADEGNYVSPINEEELRAIIDGIKANIEAAKDAEAARVAANQAAAEADVEKLEGYQAEISAAIKDNEQFISADTKQQIETLLGDTYMILIQQALDAVAEEGVYESPINDEWWAQQIADIKAEIEANKIINEDVWTAIKAQIANVQEAIDNFDTIVATMMYASRYEGEEITEPVDAAREWVATTTETYQAKYEAGELTQEDGVMGEMYEQIDNVMQALNLAAQYDAGRYVFGAAWAWFGNEDEEIVGAKDAVMEVYNNLPEESKAVFDVQLETLEHEIQTALEAVNLYTAYNEDTHAELIAMSQEILSAIDEIVAEANAASYEMLWMAAESQIATVQEAIDNFDTIVATMAYASRYEGEEITGLVDAARAWVADKTETLTAKYEAGELTEDDLVKGEMMEQLMNVAEALNYAAMYDVNCYGTAVTNLWIGDEDEFEGVRDALVAKIETLDASSQSAFTERVQNIDAAWSAICAAIEAYTQYSEDAHAEIVALCEETIAEIQALVDDVDNFVPAEPVTEPRTWDFTTGAAYAEAIAADTENWASLSKGRYKNAKALENEELTIGGEVIEMTAGLLFTAAAENLLLGTQSGNLYLQYTGGNVTMTVPNCAKGDVIEIGMCSSGKNKDAVLTFVNVEEESYTTQNTSKETVKVVAAEDGDVKITGNANVRLYALAVTPAALSRINNVNSVTVNNDKVYNLNGIEVKTMTKGLYIVNGKKIIVK